MKVHVLRSARKQEPSFCGIHFVLKITVYALCSVIIDTMFILSRLQNKVNRVLCVAFVGILALVLGWFCLIASNTTQHSVQMQDMSASCANCHLDGQTSVAPKIDEEKDDIEPTPPPFWVRPIVPLAFLYNLIPITFLGYLILRHKIHLTTQMRF